MEFTELCQISGWPLFRRTNNALISQTRKVEFLQHQPKTDFPGAKAVNKSKVEVSSVKSLNPKSLHCS